jgi:hypothetical protein
VAAKFIDQNFNTRSMDPEVPVSSIKTKLFDSIYRYQNIKLETLIWIWALFGKCLYDIGELEDWQCYLFIKGVPGTGKSTTLKVLSFFYDAIHRATVSANLEKIFGITQFKDKFLNFCYESKNLGIHLGDFASMISGEEVSIPGKFKDADTMTWVAPFILAGDGFSYGKGSDCLLRRTAMVEFTQRVAKSEGKTDLCQVICNREATNLLIKFNRAYLEAVNQYANKDIWSVIDGYFTKTRNRMNCHINSLASFIDSGDEVELDRQGSIPFKTFRELYKKYCGDNSIPAAKVDDQSVVLQEFGLRVERDVCFWMGRNMQTTFIKGVRLITDNNGAGTDATGDDHDTMSIPPPPMDNNNDNVGGGSGDGDYNGDHDDDDDSMSGNNNNNNNNSVSIHRNKRMRTLSSSSSSTTISKHSATYDDSDSDDGGNNRPRISLPPSATKKRKHQ